MKLIVTGGAGFLGLHICNELKDFYDEITIIDIADYEASEYPDKVKYIKGDVRDYQMMEKCLKGADLVVHAAAALPLWPVEDIMTTGTIGTRNVMEAAIKNGVKRVTYISSTAVYGVPDHHPLYETDEMVGVGPYGEAKIQAEHICNEYRDRLCIPIVRPKTFIGTARLGVFQILYDWVESGVRIPVIGDGTNPYQLMDVRDLVQAIHLTLSLEDDKVVNDTFNCGAKDFGATKDDVQALCDYAATGSKVLTTPAWLVIFFLEIFWQLRISPLYKWVYGTAHKESFVSIEKAEEVLGWKPQFSNAKGLINAYQWYLDNKEKLNGAEGLTHRVAWKQGILSVVKKIFKIIF